jgi:hypothetical protein
MEGSHDVLVSRRTSHMETLFKHTITAIPTSNMDPLETYPLTLNLTHKWDDEADTTIKTSILSFLTSTKTSAYEVALDISLAFKPEHNIDGFRDEVEDICIYTSKFLPANHVAQDKLVEIVEAVRGLPECVGQPQWRYLLQTGSYSLVEAFGESCE